MISLRIPVGFTATFTAIGLVFFSHVALAQASLRIAVAANFKPVLDALSHVYTEETGDRIEISVGATGALYAQIRNGAPFDVFLAADSHRPAELESAGLTRHRSTYAYGQLALWQPANRQTSRESMAQYTGSLSIANPRHAPYGKAATDLLNAMGKSDLRLIRGSNVAQAYTFVATGNAPAGLVALSQLLATNVSTEEYWIVPEDTHDPIQQQLVIMISAVGGAELFVSFLKSPLARRIIESAGYRLPSRKEPGSGS